MAIILLGSSSVSSASSFPRALAAELGEETDARGVVGARVRQWREWTGEGAHGTSPAELAGARVVVLLGGNDSAPSSADIQAIDKALSRAGAARVVWLPPPAYLPGSVAHGRDVRMRAALAAAGVRYVHARVPLERREYARDLVHPTRDGYSRWARLVAPELRAALAPPDPRGAGLAIVAVLAVALVLMW